ncbi:2,3-dihydroxybenzoate-AMP ligase [Variovorax sp. PBL-H6]|uniref:AMP-binding protein n=1 Tax=Variovorax sp. PBL-H6 TaxID=434009 RepID=UPI0013168497|nr:AMP-binding protein [Variovorax sp. PBL-H6]VTU19021.1 2,3-dihydroxybenzoate-AMP ligase [Variovorax sp. PBL-H6]
MSGIETRPRLPLPEVVYTPAAQAERYLREGAWRPITIGNALRQAAREFPQRTAYVCDDRRISFAEVDEKSSRLAAGLHALGLRPGDRALFQMGTDIKTALALFGCFKAGVLPVCTIPQYRSVEISALAQVTRPRAFFVQADVSPNFDQVGFAAEMAEAHHIPHLLVSGGHASSPGCSIESLMAQHPSGAPPEEWNHCDVAALQLSGGSTGVPKVIPRYHGEYLAHTKAWCDHFGCGDGDVGIWALPMLHNAGMMFSLLRSVLYGATTVLMPKWDVARFFSLMERERVQHAFTIGPHAPSIAGFPGAANHDLSSLKLTLTLIGAEPIERGTARPATNMYGITEGLVLASAPHFPPAVRHGSIGTACWEHDEVRILEPGTEKEVPLGESGELCFRGPSSLRGYYAAPEITAASMTSDGFFRTADMVRACREGQLTVYQFEGRMRDNINRGGEKFGTEDIELLLARHPQIADGKVVAMPDPIYGEKACAYLIPREGAALPSVPELAAFLVSRGLAKYKCPEHIEAVSTFPITRVGKLDRQQMRQAIAEKLAGETQGG